MRICQNCCEIIRQSESGQRAWNVRSVRFVSVNSKQCLLEAGLKKRPAETETADSKIPDCKLRQQIAKYQTAN